MKKKYTVSKDGYGTRIIDITPSAFDPSDSTIVFPAEVDGKKITSINISQKSLSALEKKYGRFDVVIENGIKSMKANMFENSAIREVTIPPSIEEIPNKCFFYSRIEKVNFKSGSSLKIIGTGAFAFCMDLKKISLPNTVDNIQDAAFKHSALEEITFPNTKNILYVGENAFGECIYLKKATFPAVTVEFGPSVFYRCYALQSVEISNIKTESIPDLMFGVCKALADIKLPESVIQIGELAFSSCSALKTVGLADTQTVYIKKSAFEDCRKYSDSKFPLSLKFIGERAFKDCLLDEMFLPHTLETVGDEAFAGNRLSYGVNLLPFANCIAIGDMVFTGCGMSSVSLVPFNDKENVSCKYMFAHCENLKTVHMDDSAKLYDGIFDNCIHLDTLALAGTLTSIPDFSFKNCNDLKYVRFPKSVNNIGESAFKHSGIEKVDLSNNDPIYIGQTAFYACDLGSIKLPRYGCTIDTDGFNDYILSDIADVYPLAVIKQ